MRGYLEKVFTTYVPNLRGGGHINFDVLDVLI